MVLRRAAFAELGSELEGIHGVFSAAHTTVELLRRSDAARTEYHFRTARPRRCAKNSSQFDLPCDLSSSENCLCSLFNFGGIVYWQYGWYGLLA